MPGRRVGTAGLLGAHAAARVEHDDEVAARAAHLARQLAPLRAGASDREQRQAIEQTQRPPAPRRRPGQRQAADRKRTSELGQRPPPQEERQAKHEREKRQYGTAASSAG